VDVNSPEYQAWGARISKEMRAAALEDWHTARTMDARGFIPHGLANVGLGARIARKGSVGVVVGLLGAAEALELAVVWLSTGASLTAARDTYDEYRAGQRVAETVPAAGLVAIEGQPHRNGDLCIRSESHHVGLCMIAPADN